MSERLKMTDLPHHRQEPIVNINGFPYAPRGAGKSRGPNIQSEERKWQKWQYRQELMVINNQWAVFTFRLNILKKILIYKQIDYELFWHFEELLHILPTISKSMMIFSLILLYITVHCYSNSSSFVFLRLN